MAQSSDPYSTVNALEVLYAGVQNSISELTTDGFTQHNPPNQALPVGTVSKTLAEVPRHGVLAGSVAFTRPDAGNGLVGGPLVDGAANPALLARIRPVGLFIEDAQGYPYENTPAPASGINCYTSAQGSYGVRLYETQDLSTEADLVWQAGDTSPIKLLIVMRFQ
jgi:hypothetical protein